MNSITRFQIKNLHGHKNLDLRIKDNTLILVGENGAGKTTVLHLFYYLISGQWNSIARYNFESISITIDKKKHSIRHDDFEKPFLDVSSRFMRDLPESVRRRFLVLLEESEGRLVSPELEVLCDRYNVPLSYVIDQINLFGRAPRTAGPSLRQTLEEISSSLESQVLYLPTYRRIEQELSLIFSGLDERDIRGRRELFTSKRGGDSYVELVEFGMKDVQNAIDQTLSELSAFARENLNNLTFGYLGDIVEKQYSSVDLKAIRDLPEQRLDNILNRIQEHILSSKNKQMLRDVINGVKSNKQLDDVRNEHTQVICHYFIKLMAFQGEIEKKEDSIRRFCQVCNEYMVDKEFIYDISKFSFTIRSKAKGGGEIKLHSLSSGEKQIVSLFSHLYLSGRGNYFVLIDEPELSLSVPWQRRFLTDIRNASFCNGLIAVTHSPFIYDNELRSFAHGLGEFAV